MQPELNHNLARERTAEMHRQAERERLADSVCTRTRSHRSPRLTRARRPGAALSRMSGWTTAAALVPAAVVQTIGRESPEPIWMVGWIPAVLVGSARRSGAHCKRPRHIDRGATLRITGQPYSGRGVARVLIEALGI